MALKPGTRVGPYEITAPLGAGGMGEVYRATDTKLKRDVAIKVLPDDVAADRERLARFEREAHVLASLNHPHIAAIYGLEESGGVPCLVLELVEGQTLAERLTAGALPVEKALEVAKQIASALEAAHEKGVVHRDLKPANVKITPEESVKVLDFGLAKAFADEAAEISGDASLSPTLPMSATRAGVILGTAAYMSPEQARGKRVDKRTDVWAFGCVLYEMLTGRQAFPGETPSDSIAGILEREPKWKALPPTTPLTIQELLQRCLRKEHRDRLHDVGDARIEIEEVLAESSGTLTGDAVHSGLGVSGKRGMSWRTMFLLIAGIAVGAAGLAIWNAGRGERAKVNRVSIVSSERLDTNAPLLVSPDGRSIAYVTAARGDEGDTTLRIVTRRLDRFAETPVSGDISIVPPARNNLTQSLTYSPDGRWLAFIGFFSPGSTERRLYKTAADRSGQPVVLADLPANVLSILWTDDETILGAARVPPSFLEFPAQGGEVSAPVLLESSDLVISYLRPTSVLPGARCLLVAADSYNDKGWQLNVALLDRQTGSLRFLIQGANPVWSPTGHILFTRSDQLLAVGFDPDTRQTVGGAVPIEAGFRPSNWGDGLFDVGPDGTLAYFQGGLAAFQRRVSLVDRNGRVEPWSEESGFFSPLSGYAISPDGRWIVLSQLAWERGLEEVWVSDFETPRLRPFAAVPGMDCGALGAWSHDSQMLAYHCFAREETSVFLKPVDGSGEARVLFSIRSPEKAFPTSFSGDDAVLLMDRRTSDGSRVDALRLGENSEPVPLLGGTSYSRSASYSPDGRWIAYESDASGSKQVYVRSITPDLTLGPPRAVSSKGGESPVWSQRRDGDGFVLFYRSGADLVEVRIVTEPALRVLTPQKVHDLTELRTERIALTGDGRFVFAQHSKEEDDPHQINVIFNIFEELRQRSPMD